MKQDIDFILEGWELKPGVVQARLVQARGRQVIQMRVDLGALQMEAALPGGPTSVALTLCARWAAARRLARKALQERW